MKVMVMNQIAARPFFTKVSKTAIIEDYRIGCISREVSLLGRREVLTGKGKFGIFGDGKELPQLALAKVFKDGDFRAGYYRDQTFMFALGLLTVEQFFAQMYADAQPGNDPFSGGRQMNAHFATPYVDKNGAWLNQAAQKNISADVSCTAGQVARAVGLAQASKLYRNNPHLKKTGNLFSNNGNEVCFVTIGDASTSEGAFWEMINAAGVLKIPLGVSIWDDGYGISVPTKYQTTKQSIYEVLQGFAMDKYGNGLDIYQVKGWDYVNLVEMYDYAIERIRASHIPAVFHITELTQPQGHSSSGSHERYKSAKRLAWEKEYDCMNQMYQWILAEGILTERQANGIRKEAKKYVKDRQKQAWKAYTQPIKTDIHYISSVYQTLKPKTNFSNEVATAQKELSKLIYPDWRDVVENVKKVLRTLKDENTSAQLALEKWLKTIYKTAHQNYHTHLYNESPKSALKVKQIAPAIRHDAPLKNGYEILNTFFDKALKKHDNLIAFGEDVGKIGGVNQGFAGLQAKYGEHRVFDTGIREWTIMGQGIGLAMRGFRPIAEIQYLDYLVYGLPPLMDDLATLQYRTDGIQIAPMIVRTRGHRLEGIWHSGSPMGLLLNSLRGMCILVPRNMTQAVGFYNTMLQSNDSAVIIEVLNGYRQKEPLPDNIGEYTVPVGVPEILQEGSDVTLVTYGACVRIAQKATKWLAKENISVELVDVQSLLPFDVHHIIGNSLKKTNRIVFLDEDVPGGATGFMMQQVLDQQKGYGYLDSPPVAISAKAHRPPYGTNGDYFSKPNAEQIFEAIYGMMHEVNPIKYPSMYFLK